MIEIYISGVSCLIVGAYAMWMHNRVNILERFIDLMPTTEELAMEIMKMKIPVTDLPQEMQDNIKKMMIPPNVPQPMQPNAGGPVGESYIG